ncbi:hypothetical protein FRB95_005532 [Tulasnella sp. JGI-2019a]|nr:hypothetical protein FRB95_005532 [Tulasnella sp. JGI-2019a]
MLLACVLLLTTQLGLAKASAPLTVRQAVSEFPVCAIACTIQPGAYGNCLTTDTACLCASYTYVSAVRACVDLACTTASDRLQAGAASTATCAAAGVNLATVTSGITSTTSSIALASTTDAAGYTAFSTMTAADPYASASSAYSNAVKTTATTVIVGGVVGGGGGLIFIVLLIILFRRRSRQRYAAQQPVAIQTPYYGGPQGGAGGGMMMGEADKTPYAGTPGVGPNTYVPYQVPVQQPQQEMNYGQAYSTTPMTTATPPPPPPAAPSPAMSPVVSMPTPVVTPAPQHQSTPLHSSNDVPPNANGSSLSTQQLEMMQKLQRLSPQQLEMIERMEANGGSGGQNAGPGQSGGEAPPVYDFKAPH